MTVEPDTTEMRSRVVGRPSDSTSSPPEDWTTSALVRDVLEKLPQGSERFVACAPGRLDVLGGLAEYTGARLIHMPIGEQTCVAVSRRTDDQLSVMSIRPTDLGGNGSASIALSSLNDDGDPAAHVARLKASSGGLTTATARCVLGTLVEMQRCGLVARFDGGLTIALGSTLSDVTDAGSDASLAAATLVALAGAYGVNLDPSDATALCQRVENIWLESPVGTGDAACALLGEANTLAHLHAEPFAVCGKMLLPDDLALVGVDSGVTSPDAVCKYAQVRTAAFMGRALIGRIIQHEGGHDGDWNGSLAHISVNEFVERFRDRIPTKLAGQDFLERFGETGDSLTRIDPDFVYKIRSRTEHHIYEHARACRFVECFTRADQNGRTEALGEAGELMHASHWSYGQRCGLGSIETDLLVNLIRKGDGRADIYGAKITGRGCGGVVAVLMQATDRAWNALHAVIETYKKRTGREARLICGSSPGALRRGVRKIESPVS